MSDEFKRVMITNNYDMTIYNDNMRPVLVDVISPQTVFKHVYEEILSYIYTIDYNITQLMKGKKKTHDNIGGVIIDNLDAYCVGILGKPFSIVSYLTEIYGRNDYTEIFYLVYYDIVENMSNVVLSGYQPYTWHGDKLLLKSTNESKITSHYKENMPKEAVSFYNACCKDTHHEY